MNHHWLVGYQNHQMLGFSTKISARSLRACEEIVAEGCGKFTAGFSRRTATRPSRRICQKKMVSLYGWLWLDSIENTRRINLYKWYMSISYKLFHFFYIHRICRTSTFLHPLSIWSLIFWAHFLTIPTLATLATLASASDLCLAAQSARASAYFRSPAAPVHPRAVPGRSAGGSKKGRPWEGWWNLGKSWKKSGWSPCPFVGNMWGNGWKLRLGPWISTWGNWKLRRAWFQSFFWCLTSLGPSYVSNCSIWHHFTGCFLPCCISQLNQAIENITTPYKTWKKASTWPFSSTGFLPQKNPNIPRL